MAGRCRNPADLLVVLAGEEAEEVILPPRVSLQAIVDEAIRHNVGVRIERSAVRDAAADVDVAIAPFDPRLSASGRVTQTERATVGTATAGTQVDNRNYNVSVDKRFITGTELGLSSGYTRRDSDASTDLTTLDYNSEVRANLRQPILRGFGSTVNLANLRRAESRYAESRIRFRERILEILANTENAYWEIAYAEARVRLLHSSIELAESVVEEARERLRLGLATELDVLRAQSTHASRKEETLNAERALQDARDELLRQIGRLEAPLIPDLVPVQMTLEDFAVEDLPESDPTIPEFVKSWDRALRNDPVIQQREEQLYQREIDRRVARNNLRPSLDLVASGALLGRDETAAFEAFDNAVNRDGHSWSLGVEFSVPWGTRESRARLRQADLRKEQTELQLIDRKSALYQQVRRSWRDLQTSIDRVEASMLTRELQARVYEQEEARYSAGMSATRDLLEAQSDWDAARTRYLEALRSQMRASVNLSRLDGTILERHGFAWDDSEIFPE